jgi:uncharacterized protein DUF4252
MKKIIFVIAILAIIPSSLFSQNKQMEQLFSDYENVTNFDYSMSTNDSDINLGLDSDLIKLFNSIKKIYVIEYTGKDLQSSELITFQKKINKIIDKGDFKPMLELSSDGVLKILLKRNGQNDPSEIVLIKEDEHNAMFLWATN